MSEHGVNPLELVSPREPFRLGTILFTEEEVGGVLITHQEWVGGDETCIPSQIWRRLTGNGGLFRVRGLNVYTGPYHLRIERFDMAHDQIWLRRVRQHDN